MKTAPSAPVVGKIPLKALAKLLAAPARWKLLYQLARHDLVSTRHLAAACAMKPATVCMHMRALIAAGIVRRGMGELYQYVPAYRPAPGADYLDLGLCRLLLPPPPAQE